MDKNADFNNIKEIINNSVRKHPDSIAFTIKNKDGENVSYRKISYQKLGEEINAFGTELISMGLKGKRIAIISKNRYEWVLSYCAILNGVGIAVPLDKGTPEQEIISSLQRAKVDAIIYEDEYSNTMEKIKNENLCDIKNYILMKDINLLIENGKKKIEEGDRSFIDAQIDNDAMSIILFTSGTTSISKAVMLSHRNIASNISAMMRTYDFNKSDVNIAFLPFHHTFGSTCILLMLAVGADNVFCDGLRHVQENLKEYGVSVFVAVPLILEAMHKKIIQKVEKMGKANILEKGKKISNFLLKFKIDVRRKIFKDIIDNLGGKIRLVVSGAAAINKQVCEDFNAWGIKIIQGYGLTETSPVLTAELPNKVSHCSVGVPLDNVQIKVNEPNESGIGEIIAKGPNIMLGYYENEEATREVLKDGWFYTGDLGYLGKKDHYLYISGRKKSVIVLKNGKNVYPEELEILINKLPYVQECLVFGYPKGDDVLISAKIVYNKEYVEECFPDLSKEEFESKVWNDIKEINNSLTTFKHIKKIIVTDEEMIKTTTAKVKRFEEIKKILKDEK